jgi:hypothetical protein
MIISLHSHHHHHASSQIIKNRIPLNHHHHHNIIIIIIIINLIIIILSDGARCETRPKVPSEMMRDDVRTRIYVVASQHSR